MCHVVIVIVVRLDEIKEIELSLFSPSWRGGSGGAKSSPVSPFSHLPLAATGTGASSGGGARPSRQLARSARPSGPPSLGGAMSSRRCDGSFR